MKIRPRGDYNLKPSLNPLKGDLCLKSVLKSVTIRAYAQYTSWQNQFGAVDSIQSQSSEYACA